MLIELSIQNFAIIDQLQLELPTGLTVLTGETGAGKSIMFDALELATGARADKSVVRHDQKRAEVVARFDLRRHPRLQQQLQEQDFDIEDGLMLRRIIGADGRSRAYINGTPVPVATLHQIGSQLVEIHGQHEHQTLANKTRQLDLLDAFANQPKLANRVRDAFEKWQATANELELLRGEIALSPAEAELLSFQRDELRELADDAARLEQLHSDHARLANAGGLVAAADQSLRLIDGNGDDSSADEHSACAQLAQARRTIEEQSATDPALGESLELLDNALIQAQEASAALNRYRDSVEVDTGQLRQLEDLLAALHDAARKHRVEVDDLPQKLHEIDDRLARSSDAAGREASVSAELDKAATNYRKLAQELSLGRVAAGSRLSDQITELMQQLGMSGGQFEIVVESDPERPFRPQGLDEAIFMVSANPGQPPQPLSKVASGGELSRISLAIKVALIDIDDPGTLIFDEVDAGVGGAVAQIVGEKLRQVAQDRQVFCITHLPQVAACGHHHLRVAKQVAKNLTTTTVEPLSEKVRTEEVARMLGGVKITAKTTAHAAEMIRSAKD